MIFRTNINRPIAFILLLILSFSLFSCVKKETNTNGTDSFSTSSPTTSGINENGTENPKQTDQNFVTPNESEVLTAVVPITEENPALIITELMVLNTAGIKDDNGNCSAWIEFFNQSDSDVSLSDYTLEVEDKGEFKLPDLILSKGEYFLLFANGAQSHNSIAVSLSSKGKLTLFHGDLIAAKVNYANITANHSFIVYNGSETSFPTPGYEKVKEKDDLIISEVMSSNSAYHIDGVDCDWIELYNNSEYQVDLSNYYITTDITAPYAEKMPSIVIDKGQYAVIACGKDVSFNLSKDGESVYITRNDGVLAASVTLDPMEKNTSWTFDCGIVDYPSPGYENTKEGNLLYINSRSGLIISEIISSNSKYSMFNGEYCDIVELYNNSNEAVILSEYYLSDKGSVLQKYRLPEVSLGAGEYYTVYCDSNVSGAAPFGISADGETLYLSKGEGYLVDVLVVPAIPKNKSWGRKDGKLLFFNTPTVNKPNEQGQEGLIQVPLASVPSGIYNSQQTVTLSGEGIIYYTVDGSKPTVNSPIYNGEVFTISENTSIRAIAYDGNKIPSEYVTYNYFINIPDYTLPVVKLSVYNDDLFGEKGIYTNYLSEREVEGNLAFYVDGAEEFSLSCGVKIHGEYSRQYTKKSFQIEFRSKYGQSRLEYPLFDNLDITSFDNIVLRSGSQSLYASEAMITDEFISSLAMSKSEMPYLLVQAYKPCNLYINDQYFGVYFIREKIDQDFIADHFQVSPESVSIIRWTNDLEHGASDQGWSEIWDMVYKNKLDFTVEENYRYLADRINLESFIDLIIMRMYAGDVDFDNVRAFKSPEYDGGRWNFILHDSDLSFQTVSYLKNRFYVFLKSESQSATKAHSLFRALMENEEFVRLFLSRFSHHIESTLEPNNIKARLDAIVLELENDMPYQIDRWKDDDFYLETMQEWRENLERLYYRSGEERIRWFVLDVVNTLSLDKDSAVIYMGEGILKYFGN